MTDAKQPVVEAPLDALREALGDATVYALRVGKALRDLIDVVSSDGDEPRRMRHAVSKAVTEGRAALSAPPPPPRELLGKEGADGEAEALLRELGVEASGGRVHVAKHWLARASAPPRKAPRPRTANQLLREGGDWAGEVRRQIQRRFSNGDRVTWGSLDYLKPPATVRDLEEIAAEAVAAHLRESAPSSPEEQLSEGATTKKEG